MGSSTHSHVRPDTYLFLRLPTETLRLVEIKLNTIIEVGKIGSFPSSLLVGRPYYHTYELLEKREKELYSRLRVVSPTELQAEAGLEDTIESSETRSESATGENITVPEQYDLLAAANDVLGKTNRVTVDDASRQQLSQADIEELKKSASGKEIVEKILSNHSALDEKTAFSKAKYTLRKHKKYLKRFTVLPMDLGNLIEYVMSKEPPRIMEMREESLGLVTSWSNAHFTDMNNIDVAEHHRGTGDGRYLVCDETGGLIVAALAERMDILRAGAAISEQQKSLRHVAEENDDRTQSELNTVDDSRQAHPIHRDFPIPATDNTITLLHPAVQPNLSLLKYFGYDTSSLATPSVNLDHPLHTHLKPLSWLQLLYPKEDPTYTAPESVTEKVLSTWKSAKRGNYYKKKRRWERCKAIVDETRKGGFDALVIATHMDPVTILEHTVPLISGGGHIVIYSPTIEPLARIADLYSKERKTAYIALLTKGEEPAKDDFPLDPRLLLAPTVQTSRIRRWQVLPGRTHPLMTARGGAEGYVFTARRVLPLEGGVEARGNFSGKRRKLDPAEAGIANVGPSRT